MNRNLEKARSYLSECTLAIVNSAGVLTFSDHGVRTLLSLERGSLLGAFVADKVVGKAAALLIVRGGALEVYAELVSEPALEVFKKHRVLCVHGSVVPNIRNRTDTGICPMEEAVLSIDDPDEAYAILVKKTGGAK